MARQSIRGATAIGWTARLGLVGLGLAAWFAPRGPSPLSTSWATGVYPGLQAALTRLSNLVPVALLDVSLAALLAGLAWGAWRVARRLRAGRRVTAIVQGIVSLAACASILYAWFLGTWGLNYRRAPLRDAIDYSETRLTAGAARRWAERAVGALNTGRVADQPGGVGSWDEVAADLAGSFASVQRELGIRRPARPGRPKASLVALGFERAGVSGLTDPWWLEVIPDPAALPAERPAILAHEWAHLAGYADEGEASFVGWLVAVGAGPESRYSAWLAVVGPLLAGLPAPDRAAVASGLDAGPRRDLAAIEARAGRAWPVLRRVAWRTYDRYLRAHAVEEGVASYRGVARLLVGSRFVGEWKVAVRPSAR